MKAFVPNKLLECLPRTTTLPKERLRWNTNEEIASFLISFDRHDEWLSCTLKTRPQNGSIILYNRKKVKYRKDGYCWKKRKDGKTTREDHMKLKVQGMECLYGCYVHSSIVPTFHRRCYWLLQNPDIVLVHYLNVPSLEDSVKSCSPVSCALTDRRDSLRWSRDELLSQLKPMFHSLKWSCGGNSSVELSVEQMVQQILETQQTKPQPRTHTCLCGKHTHTHTRPTLTPHSVSASSSPSPPPSTSPQPLSLALSLSPTSPPSSLSSLSSETERKSIPGRPSSSLSFSLSPTQTTPVLLPLCLESSLELDSLSSPLSVSPSDDRAPPTGFAAQSPPSHLLTNLLSPATQITPSLEVLSTNQLPPEGEKAESQHSMCIQPPNRTPPPATPPSMSPVQAGLTFDSAFPDLISEHIIEEPVSHLPTLAPPPTPSTSFLPFPLLTNSGGNPAETQRLANITDFSPEWSYPEGGVKVLITGPWSETDGRYSCVFDQSRVPASLIQPGVLRCYCPAHEAGLVALYVLKDSSAVSSSVLFEYRARNASSLPSSQLDWLSLDDNQFRMSILERLEQMERRMAEMSNNNQQNQHMNHYHQQLSRNQSSSGLWFERRIVALCERMMASGRWERGGETDRLTHSVRHRGMTLLHLAAAQGYTQLIHTLIRWRSISVSSLDLEQEVDPLNVDHFSCTPLMWACALGHQAVAVLLYRWSSAALGIPDSLGRLPLAVAHSRGHTRLARCLEELHTHSQTQEHTLDTPSPPYRPLSPLSSSPDTGNNTHTTPLSDPISSSSSVPSPSDPPSPSPSSAYSSGSVPDPMDSASSPSSPFSAPPPAGSTDSLFLMDCEASSPSVDMATLAEQIIEATPERIKQEEFNREAESPLRERRDNPAIHDTMPWLATYLDTVDRGLCPTPPSLLSDLALQRLRPPSSAAWAEFLNASANGRMERDFALLTLTDTEQRELYEAARVIQNAFRRYKGRRLKEQQDMAAAVIQRCYRKYKQLTWIALKYALYKKMTQAAILIQSKFRSYYEQKKFQQSRRAAVLIQQYYRSYKEYERVKQGPRGPGALNTKGSFLTKKQDQAARKIMRFLRRCRHRYTKNLKIFTTPYP
uniref:CG-1 domain-containing protein n=1 Tax=Cyprinus carpio carpio TaxID=630221 RepID=A0A9J7YN58_CYPCA